MAAKSSTSKKQPAKTAAKKPVAKKPAAISGTQNLIDSKGAKTAETIKYCVPEIKDEAPAIPTAPTSMGQSFGEMVWLLTQSPIHKNLKLADLEWLLMPAILMNQARVFKVGTQAVGLALWAYLTPEEAAEMNKAGRLKPENWRHGTDIRKVLKANAEGTPMDLTPPTLKDGELELWLVDLVVPHATPENKLAEACLSDLLAGPLAGKKLKMQRTDAKTGEKTTIELGGE